jgi:hypothetical protein
MSHLCLYYFLYGVDDRLIAGATAIVAGDMDPDFFS